MPCTELFVLWITDIALGWAATHLLSSSKMRTFQKPSMDSSHQNSAAQGKHAFVQIVY
jgi:hypothetical protein